MSQKPGITRMYFRCYTKRVTHSNTVMQVTPGVQVVQIQHPVHAKADNQPCLERPSMSNATVATTVVANWDGDERKRVKDTKEHHKVGITLL